MVQIVNKYQGKFGFYEFQLIDFDLIPNSDKPCRIIILTR